MITWQKTIAALVIFMVGVMTPIECGAQKNHSLQWGVSVGDEFEYILQKKYIEAGLQEYLDEYAPYLSKVDQGQKIISNVTGLENIPEHIDNVSQMPQCNCTLIRANDSTVLVEDLPIMVVPIGDWNFSATIMNFTQGDVTTIDTDTDWGRIISSDFYMGIVKVSFYWEMRYLKVNGTLKKMTMRVVVSGSTWIDFVIVQVGQETQNNALLLAIATEAIQVAGIALAIYGSTFIYRGRIEKNAGKRP